MLKKNLVANLANQLVGIGVPVISQVYVIRTLDIIDIGIWNVMLAVQAICTLFFSYLGLYAIREISSKRTADEESICVTTIIATSYLMLLPPIFGALLYLSLIYPDNWFEIIICFFPLLTTPIASEFYFQAKLRNDLIFWRRLIFRSIFLILLVVYVNEHDDFKVFVIIYSGTTIAEHIANFYFVRNRIIIRNLTFKNVVSTFRSSIIFLPFNISFNVLPQLSLIIAAKYMSGEATGVYSILVKLVNLATTFVSSAVMVTMPYLKTFYSKNAELIFKRHLLNSIMVALAICIFLVIFKDYVFLLFLNDNLYSVNGSEFSVLVVFVPIHVVYNYLCFNYYIVQNRIKILVGLNLLAPGLFFLLFVQIRQVHDFTFSQIYVFSVLIPAVLLAFHYLGSKKSNSSSDKLI